MIEEEDRENPVEVHVAAFSGGRSSAMMTYLILASETLPLKEVIFANTGMETPETLEFVRAVNKPFMMNGLVALEFKVNEDGSDGYKVVEDLNDLDTSGEPFKALVKKRQYLPNKQFRLCTEYLKIRPIMSYIYDKYGRHSHIYQYLGIRKEERSRIARIRMKNDKYMERLNESKYPLKWTNYVELPLVDAGVDRNKVQKFWEGQGKHLGKVSFDVTNPSTRLSNCVGCFFNGDKDIIAQAALYPEYADKWIEIESIYERDKEVENTLRERFAETYLGRKPTQAEKFTQSPLKHATWSMVKEAAGNLKGKQFAFAQQEIEWAGCGDGFCGTDI